ncbi:MAG TPA: DUF1905 domain-containing protein [Dermatophilaceae bacterium]
MTRIGTFGFAAPLWQYPGADGWHFVSLPAEISDDITDSTVGIRRGFGSVRVAVTVGRTTWRTSIFQDRKTGTYMSCRGAGDAHQARVIASEPMQSAARLTVTSRPWACIRAGHAACDLTEVANGPAGGHERRAPHI